MRNALLRALLIAPAGLLAAAAVAPAFAAVVVPLDLPALTQKADLVVVGTVARTDARWVEGRIVTRVVLKTSQVLKGTTADEVTVEVLGGEVDGIAQRVSGMAAFTVGEEAVVFLERHAETNRVVGLAQGKFTVQRDLTGVAMVPDLRGLTTATRDAKGELVLKPAEAAAKPIPLQDFVGRVTASLTVDR